MRPGRVGLDTGGLIAATALLHGLVVVTRNVRDFGNAGVELVGAFPR